MQILSGKLTAKQEFSGALHRILNQRRVPRGHVSIRNPLQAPKERSCGISILSPSLGSAKRDRLSSSTSQGMCQSPFGELYGMEVSHVPTAALLRSLQWVYDIGPASRNPQLILNLLASVGAWLRRDAIASQITLPSSTPTHSLSLCRHSRLSGLRRAERQRSTIFWSIFLPSALQP